VSENPVVINWASDNSAEFARSHGLTDEEIREVEPTGKGDAYTVGDLKKALELRGEDPDFEVDYWHGHRNYHCPHCPHATLDRAQLVEHVQGRHGPPPAPLSRIITDI